jgi:hypothetical protein
MRNLVRRHVGAVVALIFVTGWAPGVQASIIVTAVQTGGDVTLSSNGGSIDLFGLTLFGNASASAIIWPSSPNLVMGPSSATSIDVYLGTINYSGVDFGSGSETLASTGTGALFGVVEPNTLVVPGGYSSGFLLSASTSTYSGQSYASLGMTPGSYVWSFPSAETITLNITPVPIPAAAWLFASAVGLLGWVRRKSA